MPKSREPQDSPIAKGIIGRSPGILAAVAAAARVGPELCSVLIIGETGTGKEAIARLVHEASPRSRGPFVAINCATLVETLLESELFGYERGAFTGAAASKRGLFEAASGGTLFLDEVGEMPLLQQVKLLRVLQEGSIRRIGGAADIKVDVRIVAATHRDLPALATTEGFRADLYHRLAQYRIVVPPLRERGQDVLLIARSLLEKRRWKGGALGLGHDADKVLQTYPWPGNVRELQNVLNQVAIDATGPRITAREIRAAVPGFVTEVRSEPGDLDRAVVEYVAGKGQVAASEVREAFDLSKSAAQRRLQALCDRGVLAMTGQGHSCRYSVPPPARIDPDGPNRERLVIDLLRRSGALSRRDLCDASGLPDRSASRVLSDLVQGGRIQMERKGRSMVYVLAGKTA